MSSKFSLPPELGQRIVIVGTTGSGKTTLARHIAQCSAVPHIELDALHWGPQWTEAPLDVFRARVLDALTPDAWITDGNYSKVRDIVWGRADTLIWLDYSLAVIWTRLLQRTFHRVITHEQLWNGNYEDWRNAFFSRDSLFWWALKTNGRHRRDYPRLLAQPEYAHLHLIRLSSPHAADQWVAKMFPPREESANSIDQQAGSPPVRKI